MVLQVCIVSPHTPPRPTRHENCQQMQKVQIRLPWYPKVQCKQHCSSIGHRKRKQSQKRQAPLEIVSLCPIYIKWKKSILLLFFFVQKKAYQIRFQNRFQFAYLPAACQTLPAGCRTLAAGCRPWKGAGKERGHTVIEDVRQGVAAHGDLLWENVCKRVQ